MKIKTFSQEKYSHAHWFSAEKHKKQKFTSEKLPYISHLSLVAMEILGVISIEGLEEPDMAIQTALLHDTLEDTDTCLKGLEVVFGWHVADAVSALTKITRLRPETQLQDSLRRIRQRPKWVWCVKMAETITNLRSIPTHWNEEKTLSYVKESELILDSLNSGSFYLAGRLYHKISQHKTASESKYKNSDY